MSEVVEDQAVMTVRVDLGSRGYDIVIGPDLIAQAGVRIAPFAPRRRAFVLCDAQVEALHGAALRAGLQAGGIVPVMRTLAPGEGSKSWDALQETLGWLLEAGASRDDVLVAFGGGVTGDLAGLCASLMKRGMRFVQVPTTLLAQVDSSVGGKTAINTAQGKNLIGSFWQPVLVLADTGVLATLPERERRAGLAEIVKYALIDDPAFFDWLEAHGEAVLAGEAGALGHAIAVSCRAKARIVAQDETEEGVRALLNLGHTFGHALEAANGFGPALLHGEAVGAGMAMALRYSVRLGMCAQSEAERAETLLNRMGLRTRVDALDGGPYRPEALLSAMKQDKKVRGSTLPLILAHGIGGSVIRTDNDLDDLLDFLRAECAGVTQDTLS